MAKKMKMENIMDSVYGTGESKTVAEMESENIAVKKYSLSEIADYHNHKFDLVKDDNYWNLVDNIKRSQGKALEPITIRHNEKYGIPYECIAGHRRREAHADAGLLFIYGIELDMDDDEADIWMVDSNQYRDKISLYERAWSLKTKYDAIKRKNKKEGINAARSDEELAKEMSVATGKSVSRATVQRLMKLTALEREYFELIEGNSLSLGVAEILSKLNKTEQRLLLSYFDEREEKFKLDLDQADELAVLSRDKAFNIENIEDLLSKPAELNKSKAEKLKLTEKEIKEWLPDSYAGSPDEIKTLIRDLLQNHFKRVSN